jgi:superfamily II DNA or RNA helicase
MSAKNICIVSRRVKIPKRHISWDKVASDLILRDSRPAEYASREPFVCFNDGGDGYIVPKMYGVNFITLNNLEFEDRQKDGESVPEIAFSGSLREPQIEPVAETIRALETKQGGVMSLYCGFGKTTCSLQVSCHFKKKTIILVHTTALLEQWKERIEQFVTNASVGILQRDKVDVIGRSHVIALMQSVSRRKYPRELLDSFGLMIVDEAHHVCAAQLSRCVTKVGCKLRLGLSATPVRKDGMTQFLFDSIGPICARVERAYEKVLVDIVSVVSGPSDMVYMTRNGKQSPNIAKMINNLCDIDEAEFRTDLVMRTVVNALSEDRHIIVLSDRRDHLKKMGRMLEENTGVTVGFMIGGIKPVDIPAVSARKVIMATYAYCSEGLDIPSLDTCVFATPRSDIVQCCGRILRYHSSKQVPRVIDFVDDASVFHGQARKRMTYYKKLKANITKLNEDLEEKVVVVEETQEKHRQQTFPFQR